MAPSPQGAGGGSAGIALTLTVLLGAVADSAAGDDMQAAASAAQSDMAAVRDGLQKVYVDKDMLAIGELTTATTAMQKSYSALLEHCSA